jgi:Zn finger protein HypA/HybF involved in hydrogenase expression
MQSKTPSKPYVPLSEKTLIKAQSKAAILMPVKKKSKTRKLAKIAVMHLVACQNKKCRNRWFSKSKMKHPTCPKCTGHKTKVGMNLTMKAKA